MIRLVGEINPLGDDPSMALYDQPVGCSGRRLREYVLAIHSHVYLDDDIIERRNLCVGYWSPSVARYEAERVSGLLRPGDVTVLLGRRVANSFARSPRPFEHVKFRQSVLLALPHPSGMCREWNDPQAAIRARSILRVLAPHVRWGETVGEL